MILSASRRTDLPCLYADWLVRRLQAGAVVVKNPMNPAQVSRLHFSPETVDCIVFWTKDPAPLLAQLDEVDRLGYRYYFQFTLTPYDRAIEKNLREKSELIETFRQLSERIGRERVVWRYDPILFADGVDFAYHRAQFSRMCAALAPYSDTVVVSFVDAYAKLRQPVFTVPDLCAQTELAEMIGTTAKQYGLRAVACAESGDWSAYGIGRSACIDRMRIERICGAPVALKADQNQRVGCGCAESVDIGAYDTCTNGCVYCYANRSAERAIAMCAKHDPQSEILVGEFDPTTVREKHFRSLRQTQCSLF
ncbi:MAG: DUF1848 domain-containing protein [Clostridia bacterium]|nr:DUF1848 domain-containing protein [Clostridia bacterium]